MQRSWAITIDSSPVTPGEAYPGNVTTVTRRRRLVVGALGLTIGLFPVVVAMSHPSTPESRVLAACNDTVETTDSFSMDCAPNMVPDFSDQLTEAEVAEPGWNGHPGGGGR